jgi:hypothetical protein
MVTMRASRRGAACMAGVAIGVALLGGCAARGHGQAAGGGKGVAGASSLRGDYLPLRAGARWTYLVTDGRGRSAERVAQVEGPDLEWGGGAPAFRVRWELLDGVVVTWERHTDAGVVRARAERQDPFGFVTAEEIYDPAAIVLDEEPQRLQAGAEWSETFMDTAPNDRGHPKSKRTVVRWAVESTDERVTVPAGSFSCLRVRRMSKHHPTTVSWYARDVGLVKETGAGLLGDEVLALVRAGAS